VNEAVLGLKASQGGSPVALYVMLEFALPSLSYPKVREEIAQEYDDLNLVNRGRWDCKGLTT
jgi:hypothetical protein